VCGKPATQPITSKIDSQERTKKTIPHKLSSVEAGLGFCIVCTLLWICGLVDCYIHTLKPA
jgi:hypothetical protein